MAYQFGERLRQQRLARGIDLARIAAETRISARYLGALESGDVSQLPGAVFARSFARQYADFVGVSFAAIEPEVYAAFPVEERLPDPAPRPAAQGIELKPLTEMLHMEGVGWRHLSRPVLTLAAVLGVCSGVYLVWQRVVLINGGSATDRAITAMAEPPRMSPPTKLPEPTTDTLPAAPLRPAAVDSASTPAPTAKPAVGSEGGTASVEFVGTPGVNGGISVRVVASQETWVSITANGKKLFRGVLQPNEARTLTGVEHATMVIGNAGGVDVQTDGRSIGPIGPPGQVRVVQLSPEGTQIKRQAEVPPSTSST